MPKDPAEIRFNALADVWEGYARNLSSPSQMEWHAAYMEIMAMGQPAVAFILRRMRRRPGFWFSALRKLTGDNPVPTEHRGMAMEMTGDWLAWGRANGYED